VPGDFEFELLTFGLLMDPDVSRDAGCRR
jgi:hypothetical protein